MPRKATAPPALRKYRAKRDFGVTPEPSGSDDGPHPPGAAPRFVVQHHRARRDHYDFRLEIGGVLASWAVPKGPTLDPAVRSLAVHVEDHPIEYRDFEGVIPGGEYGAGDVTVWDRGTWTPIGTDDPAAAVAAGELHFDLTGEKLKGRFVLVRTRADARGREQWLLLHKHDEFAVAGWRPADHPRSVKSGRTNDEVAAAPEFLWRGDLPAAEAEIRADQAEPAAKRAPKAGAKSASKPTAKAGGKSAPKLATAPATKPTAKPTTKPTAKTATGRAAKAASKTAGRRGTKGLANTAATSAGRTGRPAAAADAATADELAALDALDGDGTWTVAGRSLKLTNLDKVLFPGRDGGRPFTKRDLIRYHVLVAPVMVPYLAERPVNLHRFPNGVDQPGFWHKQLPNYAPDWLTRWENPDAGPGESTCYAVVDSTASLAWMANYGAVELHPWTSRLPDVNQPTWALIDIDPGTATTFADAVLLARVFRSGLEHLGVLGQPKLTGQRGIHIWIPIEPGYSFEDTRTWVEKLSRAVGATAPDLVSWTWEKRRRQGLARLDYTQNARNKTLVAPYGVRAAAGAPVSAPIEWDELDDPELRSDRYTIETLPERIERVGDPFAALLEHPQRLPEL